VNKEFEVDCLAVDFCSLVQTSEVKRASSEIQYRKRQQFRNCIHG